MRVGYLICHQLSLSSIISILFTVGLDIVKALINLFLKLPDTGQMGDYSQVYGEDADYQINTPSLSVIKSNIDRFYRAYVDSNGWQGNTTKMPLVRDTFIGSGYDDWRLPSVEAYSILNHQKLNPALDITVFSKSTDIGGLVNT